MSPLVSIAPVVIPQMSWGRIPPRACSCTMAATVGDRYGRVSATTWKLTDVTGSDSRAICRPFSSPGTLSSAVTSSIGINSSLAHQRKARRIRLTIALIVVRAYFSFGGCGAISVVADFFFRGVTTAAASDRCRSFSRLGP